MSDSLYEKVTSTQEGEKLFLREVTALEVTEPLCRLMEEQGITRRQLADKLERLPLYVDQVFNGDINPTIREVSDLFWALGKRIRIQIIDKEV